MDEHRTAYPPAPDGAKATAAAVDPSATFPLAPRAASFDEIGYVLPRPTVGFRSPLAHPASRASREQARG